MFNRQVVRFRRAAALVAMSYLTMALAACAMTITPGTNIPGAAPSVVSTGTASSGAPASSSPPLIFSTNFDLYALDTASGNILWKNSDPSFTQPAVANSQVYAIAPPTSNAGGSQLVDFDGMSGVQRWSYALPGANGAFGSLVVSGNTVIAALQDVGLLALNANTGAPLWKVALNFPTPPGSLAADMQTVFVVLPNGNLDAFDIANGQLRWEKNNGASFAIAAQGAVYATYACSASSIVIASSSDICLGAFDSATGAQRWSSPLTSVSCALLIFCSNSPSAPVIGGDTIYVLYTHYTSTGNGQNPSQEQDQRVDAFHLQTGTLLWQDVIPGSQGQTSSNPPGFSLDGADGSAAYIEDATGTLTALSSSHHSVVWQHVNPNGKSDQFLLTQATAYVINGTAVAAIDTRTGSQRWSVILTP
jgi:outer membrane protein assembly factor BamB